MFESSTGIINQAEMFPSVIFHFSDGIETIISAKTTLLCGLNKSCAYIHTFFKKKNSDWLLLQVFTLEKVPFVENLTDYSTRVYTQ